jgi:hypothetical protein
LFFHIFPVFTAILIFQIYDLQVCRGFWRRRADVPVFRNGGTRGASASEGADALESAPGNGAAA